MKQACKYALTVYISFQLKNPTLVLPIILIMVTRPFHGGVSNRNRTDPGLSHRITWTLLRQNRAGRKITQIKLKIGLCQTETLVVKGKEVGNTFMYACLHH